MTTDRRQLLRTVAEKILKGGVKSIPVVGGILEEAIFGVMDAQAAHKEAAKLEFALQRIQTTVGAQTATLTELVRMAGEEVELSRQAGIAVENLLERMSTEHVDEVIVDALDDVARRCRIDIDQLATTERIEQEFERELRPEVVQRAAFISKLSNASHADIDGLVASLGAGYFVPESRSSRKTRAAKLVEWAERADGNGLSEVVFTARQLEVSGFSRAIPDPQLARCGNHNVPWRAGSCRVCFTPNRSPLPIDRSFATWSVRWLLAVHWKTRLSPRSS